MRSSSSTGRQTLRFFAKLLLGMVPLVAFYCYARFYADGYMDGEWAMYKQVKSYINEGGHHNDFLVMGDSTPKFNLNAAALSADGCSVQNIALGGGAPVTNYYVLKEYLARGNTVDTIIVAWVPVHFEGSGCFDSRTEYFHTLNFADTLDAYRVALAYKDTPSVRGMFFSETVPILKLLKAATFYPPKYLPAMNNARFVNRHKRNTDAFAFYQGSKGSHFCGDGVHPQQSYANRTSFSAEPLQTQYLRKFFGLCRQHGITVVMEQSPFPAMTQEVITQGFESDYFAYLRSFQAEFPGVQVPQKFTYYDNAFFVDAAHMNNTGNAAWTAYIKQTYIDPYIQHKTMEVPQ